MHSALASGKPPWSNTPWCKTYNKVNATHRIYIAESLCRLIDIAKKCDYHQPDGHTTAFVTMIENIALIDVDMDEYTMVVKCVIWMYEPMIRIL